MPICFRGLQPCLNPGVRTAGSARETASYLTSSRLVRANFASCTATPAIDETLPVPQPVHGRSDRATASSGPAIRRLNPRPSQHQQNATTILETEEIEKRVSNRKRWRRLMGLRASIAAGAKSETLELPDGHRLLVYWSKRGKIDFLAGGPKRTLDDLSRRMQEGEVLALQIAPHTIRSERQDQMVIHDNAPSFERLRAMGVRKWVNDLEARLSELSVTASSEPSISATPLGGLARVWFQQNPDSKHPVRPKWVSLAIWQGPASQQDISYTKPTPLTNGESIPGRSATPAYDKRATDEKKALTGDHTSSEPPLTNLHNYSSSWVTRFEKMSQGRGLNLHVLEERSLGPLVHIFASSSRSLQEIRQAWNKSANFSDYSPMQMWEDIMLWCLHNSPYRALRLLIATIQGQSIRPSMHVANDCLVYLARHFLYKPQKPDGQVFLSLLHAARKYIHYSNDNIERIQTIDDNVIYLLLRHCNDQQGQSLLELCKDNNVSLHTNTLLHFLDRSEGWGTITHSIGILRSIAKSGFDMSSDQVQSACVKLVRTRVDSESEYRVQTKIVTELLEMGIIPKNAMCNAIILNAAEAGDFGTAWEMFEITKANGLAPDSVTYGVLLKAANVNGEADGIDKALREILRNPPVMQNLRLLHDVLAAIASQNLQSPHTGRVGFKQMLALYKRYCSLAPLRDLRICGSELEGSTFKIQWPTPWLVAQMLASYAHMRRGEGGLVTTYHRYRSLALNRHPLISQLPQTDFTANAFIKAFGTKSGTLKYCPTVIKEMLGDPSTDDTPEVAASTQAGADIDPEPDNPHSETTMALAADGGSTLPLKQAQPTVRTWSILAAAYLHHGQKQAAKKVLKLMEDRGLRLDKVAWNALISGYAGMQDVSSAVDALGRMQAAGHETDPRTLMALGRIWNRGRLLDALKDVTQATDSRDKTKAQDHKKSAEVITKELEASRKKQANAERFLAGLPSELNSLHANNEVETLDELLGSQGDKGAEARSGIATEEPKARRGGRTRKTDLRRLQGDSNLDAVVDRLAGNAA